MVKLDEEVYQDLSSIGKFKESYSDIIRRLVDFYRGHANGNATTSTTGRKIKK